VPLATLGDFAALTGTTTCDNALQVEMALAAASTAAERYTNRTFAKSETTEYYDGNGYPNLPLKRLPISNDEDETPTVWLDINGGYGQTPGGFASDTQLEQGTEYVVLYDSGELQTRQLPGLWWGVPGGPVASPWGWPGLTRRGTAWVGWPKIPGCVKVTYTAGYDPIPADIVAAVVTMAQYTLTVVPGGGLVPTSGSYIDVSVGVGFLAEALARGNVPALGSARAVLDSYRDTVVARGPF
jgi:hypothetical protein